MARQIRDLGTAPGGADLAELLGLLALITDILRSFATRATEDIDRAIDDALTRIGEFTGVDRSYLFRMLDDAQTIDNTHEWCAPGIEPQLDELRDLPATDIQWWLPRLRAGEHVYVPDVAALPESRRWERELLAPQGIQSLVTVPLLAGDELIGFIGFDSVRERRTWSDGAMLLLRAVADVISGGLARREASTALAANHRRFRALVRHSSDVMLILDATVVRDLSESAATVLGWRATDHVGSCYRDAVHPEDVAAVDAALRRATAHPGAPVGVPDHRLRHADGSWRWMLATALDLQADPAVAGTIVNAHDITGRKLAEEALKHQALHDPLTRLPNRALLLDRLEQALVRSERTATQVGVIFLDLDRFKLINDALGHGSGDQLLVEVAKRLTHAVRSGDTVARFGGDEYVVLLDGMTSPDHAQAGADRLLSVFDQPFTIGTRSHVVTASAGLVLSGEHTDAESLLRDADAAMYQAKERGRARIQRFDAPLRDRLLLEVELGNDLHGSIMHGELELDFQPLFHLAENRVTGAEALLRWNHPTRGRISPMTFIPLAEESGLILPIGSWVIGDALRHLRRLRDRHAALQDFQVTVNLSVRQLTDPKLCTTVQRLLDAAELEPGALCLELTESALMAEPAAGLAVLGRLRRLGVGLAIDDFGTGYSSLAYLRDLPVTTLKIDRTFVTGLGRDNQDSRVIAAVIGLAKEFGLQTVAEGVETRAQLDELRMLGCDIVQGFHLQRPAPPAEVGALAASPATVRGRLGRGLGAVG